MFISKIIRNNVRALGAMLLCAACLPALAADMTILGPTGSVAFGTHAVALPNGNIVVTDPKGPIANIGAVYLYSPSGTLISTLTGGSTGDSIGSKGIQVLANGNFLVRSPSWRNSTTNAVKAGAVTWVNGTTGLSGAVFEGNSLVGTSANDELGASQATLLVNGNYVVSAPLWDNGSLEDAGAAIWGNGGIGVSGPVTTSNALYGTHSFDGVGKSIASLSNGNYVVSNSLWKNGTKAKAGAVTWADGTVGIFGAVSPANSLVGTSADDSVGSGGITALSNGNYVVASSGWRNGAIAEAGAVTWANGSVGLVGVVSSANSLVGSSTGDLVGSGAIIALVNGNYVVSSTKWKNGNNLRAGATTWGNGSSGVRGAVSAGNSLVGLGVDDGVSPSTARYKPLVALSNGNYVVVNPGWDNGAVADVGAVTWADGASGRTGIISASNSLIGLTAGDAIGSTKTIALANGNYVVSSERWQRGSVTGAGAVTWGNGTSGEVGVVSAANSLVGIRLNDGAGQKIEALENGNYVIASESWDNGTIVDVGAVTWVSGSAASSGAISLSNSLAGSKAGDAYGKGVLALANGDFVASSDRWQFFGSVDVGAFTRVDGSAGLVGIVSGGNSMSGSIPGDKVAYGGARRLGSNHYVVYSPLWDNGGDVDAGAVTILHNTTRTRGLLSSTNSVFGIDSRVDVTYDAVLDRAVVGRPAYNVVTVRALSLFADSFE